MALQVRILRVAGCNAISYGMQDERMKMKSEPRHVRGMMC